jgi:hypothetical protein
MHPTFASNRCIFITIKICGGYLTANITFPFQILNYHLFISVKALNLTRCDITLIES